MTIVKHRPLGSLVTPFDELFKGILDRDLSHFIGSDDVMRTQPRVNITETPEAFKLEMLAPGFGKEDLKLNVEDDLLTISAEKKDEALKENERYTRREFGLSAFKRSFRLPEIANGESIQASYEKGILRVSIPKVEPAKPAVRAITIS